MWGRAAFCALALFASATAWAMPPERVSGSVAEVIVEGNRRIEADTVLASIRLSEGDRVSPARVRRDIERIYASGFFNDVQVRAETVPGGVRLIYVVDEKPALREIKFVGNKKVNEEDIREVVDIRPFSVLNDSEIKATVRAIRDLYIDKGYYLADVTVEQNWVSEDQVELVFRVDENQKVVVQRIEFTGNDNLPDRKIKRYLQTKEGGILPWLTNAGTFKKDALETDMYLVRQVFLEEGYVDVEVSQPKVYLSPDRRYIYVSFHVEEGERYAVGDVEVLGDFVPEEGLTEESVRELIAGTSLYDVQLGQWREAKGKKSKKVKLLTSRGPHLDAGDTFKYSTLELVRLAITQLYQDQGYAYVEVMPYTDTDPETKVVKISFQINKGPKIRIGRIDITGNTTTFDKVVRRELLIAEGQTYRGSLINASQARLQRLGYFDQVNVKTPPSEDEGAVDIAIDVSEQPTGSFSLGLGFSSLEQFMFTGNVQKSNFLGLGWTMSAMVNWSALRRQWQLQFFDPYFLDSRWTFSINGFDITRQFQLDEYQRGGSIELGRYLDRNDDIRVSASYRIEDVGVTSLDPFRQRLLGGDLYRNGLTSSVGASFNIDKRNNRIRPFKGWSLTATASMAGGFKVDKDKLLSLFGGEFNFARVEGNFRLYVPLIKGTNRLVFRLQSRIGFLHALDGRTVPFIHRYRPGGIDSVRGFQWFTLGPTMRLVGSDDPVRADDTAIVGGTQQWLNNIELEAPVVAAAGITAVLFFDAGNAFGDPWEGGMINPLKMRTSIGAGVRWTSPIGPLRFELGVPLKPREGERTSVFDFGIGTFF